MERLKLSDFRFLITLEGDLNVETEKEIGSTTFTLEEDGDLWFNDMPPWLRDYFILNEDGVTYSYVGGEE